MKNIVLTFLLLVIILSCQKNEDNNNSGMVLIKGRIGSTSKGGSNSKGLSLADATKVVVFSGERYFVVDINDASFSIDAQAGSATALIFVDDANHYIGNLTVSGLNILPLVNLSDGDNTVIDLSTLTLFETSVIPANNPIGKEINISAADIEMLKEIGSYFESIAKNIDTDNDGLLDYFAGKDIVLNSEFNVVAGKAGINGTAPVRLSPSQLELGYSVRISGKKGSVPAEVNLSFTGPQGNPHPDIVKKGYQYYDHCECFIAAFMRQPQGQYTGPWELPFAKGLYNFTLDGTNIRTLYFSSLSAKYFLLMAVPVIKTNAEGIITNVELEYMLPDGTPVDNSKYVSTLAIQFSTSPSHVTHQEGSIYDVMNKLPDFENVAISKPMNINDIVRIAITYTDLVGNLYGITWNTK